MRPSISMTLEPGLDRGVPWGRDLYTFVTSAAGHMMRTLQKPRKNRPSKRQVNHRRFLHNMIQRKFADIEAANHRLASTLYFKDEDKKTQKSAEPEQSEHPSQDDSLQESDKCSADGDGFIRSRSYISVGSHETETSEKGDTQSGHLWRHFPKSQRPTWTTRKNNQEKGRQKFNEQLLGFMSVSSPKCIDHVHTVYYDEENPLQPDNPPPGDTQTDTHDAGFIQFGLDVDASPSFSPELSPLSLDSCDLSVQMFTDISNCTLAQRSVADVADSHWGDVVDLFSSNTKDFGGCADVEAFFESICSCQGDAGVEVGADEVGDLLRCDYGYSCHGNEGLATNLFQSEQSSSQGLFMNQNEETDFNNFPICHGPNITQTEPPNSISCSYNISESQMYQQTQEQSACMLGNYENNQSFTPFEGVAQSFSAPVYNLELCPVPSPPHDEDWLFTDILGDGMTPDL